VAINGPRVVRKLKTSLALSAALLFLVACGDEEPGPIMLGAAGPWTEGYGAMNKRGIELALEHLNARPEHKTRPVEVVFRDDQGNGAKAVAIAQEFVENPTVLAVIGHVNSGAMVAAAKVYDGWLPAVATTATSPDLTAISPWTFRVISSDSANGLQLARFAAKLGRHRVAILYENNSYGRGLTESFTRHFTGQVVSVDPISDAGDQNFEPFVSYYHRVRPDLVFVAGTEASGITLVREVRRQQLDVDLLGGDGWTGLSVDTAKACGSARRSPRKTRARTPAVSSTRSRLSSATRRTATRRWPTTPRCSSSTPSRKLARIGRRSGASSPAPARATPIAASPGRFASTRTVIRSRRASS
jgi:branched-chain amino acid transport system substrate-binding protein